MTFLSKEDPCAGGSRGSMEAAWASYSLTPCLTKDGHPRAQTRRTALLPWRVKFPSTGHWLSSSSSFSTRSRQENYTEWIWVESIPCMSLCTELVLSGPYHRITWWPSQSYSLGPGVWLWGSLKWFRQPGSWEPRPECMRYWCAHVPGPTKIHVTQELSPSCPLSNCLFCAPFSLFSTWCHCVQIF